MKNRFLSIDEIRKKIRDKLLPIKRPSIKHPLLIIARLSIVKPRNLFILATKA
jgi:hypothetical protein